VAKKIYNAPEQIDSLLNDLADAGVMILTVESSLQNNKTMAGIPEDQLARVCSKLEKAKEYLQEFHLLIQSRIPESRMNSKKYKGTSWLLAKSKLTKMKEKLENVLNELCQSLGQFKTYDLSQSLGVISDE
jgi:hypothetical protein